MLPYAAPYFAYVAITAFSVDPLSPELSYLLRMSVVAPLLLVGGSVGWAWVTASGARA